MFKKSKKIDFSKLVPIRMRRYEVLPDGRISVIQPRFFNSFVKKYADLILKKPDVKVTLDERGSFVWNLCDGRHSMNEIAESFIERFGESDVFDRLFSFMQYLEKCEMISYQNIKELESENA